MSAAPDAARFELLTDGTFPRYSSLGSYPLIYLTRDGNVLCCECADASVREEDRYDPVTSQHVHWEGDPLICEECNVAIESAYGPVD